MRNSDGEYLGISNLTPIESLSDYIKLLQEYPSTDFIFRGENAKFEKRQASAFRSGGRFMRSINEYYSEIGHRLSDIEKQNFLAFAQHYGLPTNLLDITSNPLSALFFACHEAKENGYVYIFSKRFLLDVTEIIEIFPRESIFDLFIAGNPTVISKMHSLFGDLFESMRGIFQFTGDAFVLPGGEFISHLFCKLFCVARDLYCERNKTTFTGITYEELRSNVRGDGVVRANELFFNGFYKAVDVERERFKELFDAICKDDIMKDISIPQNLMDDLMYYIIFILYCFRVTRHANTSTTSSDIGELFPVMIYRPKITFERARLQQGYFIYTPYMAAHGVFADIEIEFDNIFPTQFVEVKNPTQILHELDNLNVNIGTTYGDFDSIAKHIKEKVAQQTIGG